MNPPNPPSPPHAPGHPHHERIDALAEHPESLSPVTEAVADTANVSSPAVTAERHGIRAGRLAGRSLLGAVWVLSWPIVAESFLNTLVGLVDTTLAAGVSEPATDAVGAAAYVGWFISLIAMAVGVGATAVVARSIGAGRRAAADACVAQSLLIALAFGALVGAACYASGPLAAYMLNLRGEGRDALITYLQVFGFASPALMVGMVGIACCRSSGDTLRPLLIMVIVNIVNTVISWALSGVDLTTRAVDASGAPYQKMLLENPFSFDLGVSGIAWGTFSAWITGALCVTLVLSRGWSGVRLRARRLRPNRIMIARVLRVGLPNFVEAVGLWTGNFLVIMVVGLLGAQGLLGAHVVAIRIEAFSILPGFAMGMAASTLVGQFLGAGRPDLAQRALFTCAGVGAAIMGLFGLGYLLIPDAITGLFTQQPTHLAVTPTLLYIAGFIQIPFALGMVLRAGLAGAGDTRAVAALSWFSTYAVRLPLAWIFSGADIPLPGGGSIPNPNPNQWGLAGVWVGLCVELCVRACLYGARWAQGRWRRVRV